MRPRWPRSFSALLLGGFALVMLPLLFGMGYAAYAQQELAARSRAALALTLQVTRGTRQLVDDLAGLQRAAGQYFVLQDPQLRGGMRDAQAALQRNLQALAALPLGADDAARLPRLGRDEAALYARLDAAAGDGLQRFDRYAPDFDALADSAMQLEQAGNALVERRAVALTRRAHALRVILLAQAAAAVLLSLLLAALLSWLLGRPVRQIELAIQRLGAGDLRPQPAVRGPSDLVLLGEQLDWLRLRLRDLDEQKQRFLRHVSHELKTPLASLREGVALLADEVGGSLTEQQREITQIMQGNARDLQQRIENLIGYSRAQRRLDPLLEDRVDLAELLDAIQRRNDLALRARHLRVERSGTVPPLLGDRGKLDTVFENLMINALRFSPDGGVIRVELGVDDEWARVRVRDQGPGVDEADRAQLFEAFFQGRRQPAQAAPGSGLGLAIAREFARLHGGDVTLCDDAPGACFEVRLPWRPEQTTQEAR
ncbi:sensor histidine kinase QseE [mine drainage metagenome]|uniref:histidine kinase n=1 Tax=mine drainage metagenome TaxID=410659 RepID=A0A1J5QW12_9ZZZZ